MYIYIATMHLTACIPCTCRTHGIGLDASRPELAGSIVASSWLGSCARQHLHISPRTKADNAWESAYVVWYKCSFQVCPSF